MQVTVFGATGGIGRHVVGQLLAAGHDVVAYARNPAKLDREHPRLRVVTGELADRDRVVEAIHGSDAVISALGPSLQRGVTGTPVTEGTRTIVDAMRAGLDWTIARITNPTNKPATGTVRAGFLGVDKVGSAMTRTDIATFLTRQLTDTTYHHGAPAISN